MRGSWSSRSALTPIWKRPITSSAMQCTASPSTPTYRSGTESPSHTASRRYSQHSSRVWLRTRDTCAKSLDCRTIRYERSEEHTSELQSRENLVCRLLLEKKKTRYVYTVVRLHMN